MSKSETTALSEPVPLFAMMFPTIRSWQENPARVILSLDDYLRKRKEELFEEVKRTAQVIRNVTGRAPNEQEMAGFRILFMPRTEENLKNLFHERVVSGSSQQVYEIFKTTPPVFSSYDEMAQRLGL